MSIPASLFVQPILQRTNSISNPAVLVLSPQTNFSTIDSILAVNLINSPILVSVYVSTNNFVIIPPTQVLPNSILQLIPDSYFSLNPGETLFAFSDSSQSLFNINIEGRIFTEIPPQVFH